MRAIHCDSNVLHAPGTCKYCDLYGKHLQALRTIRKINFTNTDKEGWKPCPSTELRSVETINHWGGNVAVPDGVETTSDWFGYEVPAPDPGLLHETTKTTQCDLPPKGWYCKLGKGHFGSCPTWPTKWTKIKNYIKELLS